MDEITLLRTLSRCAASGGQSSEVTEKMTSDDFCAAIWTKIDAEEQASSSDKPLMYLIAAGAVAASAVMVLTWHCQDLLNGSLLWLDPVTQQYHF